MKWLKWFKAHPDEEERYQMFLVRFHYEQERQREHKERMHEEIMDDIYGPHGQG